MAETKGIYRSVRRRLSVSSRARNFLLLRLIVMSLPSTCIGAQDIITNTVNPPKSPALEILSNFIGVESNTTTARTTITSLPREYTCPSGDPVGLALIFSIPCRNRANCSFLGNEQLCCRGYCRKGLPAPPKEPKHQAVFGVNRMCPKEPVPELLPVTRCRTDADCEGETRICCPDKDYNLYCRTPAPVWSELPFPRTHAPLMSLLEYMQCQPSTLPVLDLFSQPCNRTVDCFPNLCCQEGPKKFCRPPKRSLVSLVAQATQRFARG